MFQTKSTVDKNSRKKSSKKTTKETKVLKEKIPRMSDITDIYDGDIRIFRTTKSGDVFQLRMWISEEKKYIRKTLRTRDKQIAISLAQKEYISVPLFQYHTEFQKMILPSVCLCRIAKKE